MRLNRIAFFATLLSILCFGATFKAWADDDEVENYGLPESHDFIKHRTYIGVFGTSANIDANNDFNGTEVYTTAPVSLSTGNTNIEQDFVPSIDRSFGFGVMVGHREGPWAAEFSYWISNHTGTIYTTDALGNPLTVTASAVYTTFNFDLKRYFFTSLPIQPFIDLGMNFAFLSSHNTSQVFGFDSSDNLYDFYLGSGDETDSGYGLNLGVGGEFYLGDGFSLVGGAIQRFTTWSQITGLTKTPVTPYYSGNPSLLGSLEGNGLNFYLGMTVGFDE